MGLQMALRSNWQEVVSELGEYVTQAAQVVSEWKRVPESMDTLA